MRLSAFRPDHVPSCWSPAPCGRAGQELLPARHLASPASHGLLHVPHPRPSAARRFDSAFNAWRLAPSADCSALNALRPCWSRITPCHGSLRVQHLKLRPVYGLLRIRHLAFMRRSWITPRSPPSALRHLTDRSASYAWLSVLVYGSLRTLTRAALVRFTDCSAFLSEFRTGTDYSVFDA